jgi:hypothetical protein
MKVDAPFLWAPYLGKDFSGAEIWGDPEQIQMETTSLYLGTTIAFDKEDEAKHRKHILASMTEKIEAIGRSYMNITQKLQAINAFELPRIDFRMMCGGVYQSDLRRFDSWMRGEIMRWLKIPGIATAVFLMGWRDGRFTLPSLEDRQYTMIIRTILDMMSTTDKELLGIMRQFEEEEAERYHSIIVERKEDLGGFLRWDGDLPDWEHTQERLWMKKHR